MNRLLFTSLILALFSYGVKAQFSTEELPYSWKNGMIESSRQSIPTETLPYLDMDAINKEDMLRTNGLVDVPYRFGFSHEVSFSLSNSGVWQTTEDGGRLWTLKIFRPDALSLNLCYNKFWLPESAKFICKNQNVKNL